MLCAYRHTEDAIYYSFNLSFATFFLFSLLSGYNIIYIIYYSDTISIKASINGKTKVVEYLLQEGVEVDAIGGELNGTPLQWAVR